MKIYLVRHAQAMWQLDSRESLDSSLTDLGHEQARRLGQWLADQDKKSGNAIDVAALCTSPLKRAQETAAYVSSGLHIPVFVNPDLREAEFHVADHLPRQHDPLHDFAPYECSKDYAAFKLQAQRALESLVKQAEIRKGPALAITHGGLIKTMLRLIIRSDAVCFQLYNTAINLVEWRRERWHVVHLNLWDHLTPELRTT